MCHFKGGWFGLQQGTLTTSTWSHTTNTWSTLCGLLLCSPYPFRKLDSYLIYLFLPCTIGQCSDFLNHPSNFPNMLFLPLSFLNPKQAHNYWWVVGGFLLGRQIFIVEPFFMSIPPTYDCSFHFLWKCFFSATQVFIVPSPKSFSLENVPPCLGIFMWMHSWI